jgi:hypothetical protein
MEPNAYKFSDHAEAASCTEMEAELDYAVDHESGNTQRRTRRFNIILAIIALCVVGGALGGGISASKSSSSNKEESSKSVTAPGGSGGRSPSAESPMSAPNAIPAPTMFKDSTLFPTVQNADEIKNFILTVARASEFYNPNSYNSKALAYVQGQSLPAPDNPLTMEKQAIQLYALACIYYNTYGMYGTL